MLTVRPCVPLPAASPVESEAGLGLESSPPSPGSVSCGTAYSESGIATEKYKRKYLGGGGGGGARRHAPLEKC